MKRIIVITLFLLAVVPTLFVHADSTGPKMPTSKYPGSPQGSGRGTLPTFPTSGSNPTGAVNTVPSNYLNTIKDKLRVPFGGFSPVAIPCICGNAKTAVVFFTPLHIGSILAPTAALLLDYVDTKQYSNFSAGLPAVYYLGFFKPKPGICMIGIAPYCVSIPYIGTMTMIGTGMPGI